MAREEDARARAERHEIEIRSGLRTVNETRREDGLEPSREAGTDILLIGGGLAPLSRVVQQSQADSQDGQDESQDGQDDNKSERGENEAGGVERALRQWERKCLNRVARGQGAVCSFSSEAIGEINCDF